MASAGAPVKAPITLVKRLKEAETWQSGRGFGMKTQGFLGERYTSQYTHQHFNQYTNQYTRPVKMLVADYRGIMMIMFW
jgi:hypothetical protein